MSAVASEKLITLPPFTPEKWERHGENASLSSQETGVKIVGEIYYVSPSPLQVVPISLAPTDEIDTSREISSKKVSAGLGTAKPHIKPGQEWFWSEKWQAAEREAEADLEAGRFEEFENDEDFLASLV